MERTKLVSLVIVLVILIIISISIFFIILGPLLLPTSRNVVQTPVVSREAQNTVLIDNYTFQPNDLTIIQGSSVTWKVPEYNLVGEQVVSDQFANNTRLFASMDLRPGDSFTYTFNDTGTFTYHSGINYYSNGTIKVVPNVPESVGTQGPPTPSGFPTPAVIPTRA